MFMCMCRLFYVLLSCVGRGLAISYSLVQGVLPTVLEKETEVKRKVSWMPHVPAGAKTGIEKKDVIQRRCVSKGR
jgi:hypothetical protein